MNYSSLLKRIDHKRDELVALTQDLIRIPTINPQGEAYAECAHFIGERLRKRGFNIEYVRALHEAGDSDKYPRINVVARYETAQPGKCMHFNSHIDVVEVGTGWTVPPFSGWVQSEKIYGRGSCDMKGGLAASIIACESLIEEGVGWRGALEISGTVDEESGGFAGVAYLVSKGYFSPPKVDYVIIPEPLGVDRICLGHRGVWWAEVETHGRIAHGSMPFLGDSAILQMSAFLQQIEQVLHPKLRQRISQHPVEPPGARASTLNINSIHGGQTEQSYRTNDKGHPVGDLPSPVVAHTCKAVIDRRFIVEETLAEVKQEIVDILENLKHCRHGFQYSLKDIMQFLPTHTDQQQPVVVATAQAIQEIYGKDAQYIASPGTYDQKHILRSGELKNCIAYGPGKLELAHQPDEYVDIEDVVNSSKIMALAATKLLS